MIDPLPTLWHLLLSTILTVFIALVGKMKPTTHPWTLAMLFAGSYILFSQLLLPPKRLASKIEEPTTTTVGVVVPKKSAPSGIVVPEGTFEDDKSGGMGTNGGTRGKTPYVEDDAMGPLDGLSPTDMTTRLGYLYYKTAHPYKHMTYFDFETPSDALLTGRHTILGKRPLTEYKQEMERWYPSSTKKQINARDCTNYPPGHPASCLIQPERIIEGFEEPRPIPMKEMPSLFKNVPHYQNTDDMENPPGIDKHMTRGGVIGRCRSDYCGARVIEPGNDNIIDVAAMFRSYLP